MKNGIIYKAFEEKDPSNFYIGSSSQPENIRLSKHINNCKRNPADKRKFFVMLRAAAYKNIKMVVLKRIKYTRLNELRAVEQSYIDRLKPPLNSKEDA